jgi:putative endonuclease
LCRFTPIDLFLSTKLSRFKQSAVRAKIALNINRQSGNVAYLDETTVVFMWFVYIIENKFGHFYTGICKDMARRFNEHNSNGLKCAKALKGKGPLKLLYCCQISDHSAALKMEIWIKKLSKADKCQLVANTLTYPNAHERQSPSFISELA